MAASVVVQVLTGVASNGLYELFYRVGLSPKHGSPLDPRAIVEEIARALEDDAELLELDNDAVVNFISSPDLGLIVRQLFASDDGSEHERIEQEFQRLWQLRASAPASQGEVRKLFNLLARMCTASVAKALAKGDLSVMDLRSAQRHAVLRDSLDGIQRTLEVLKGSVAFDLPAIDDFADRYRRQVASREGVITPPALDSARTYPIDELYVPARLSSARSGGADQLTYQAFAGSLYRAVVLGNPGSGKSTLAKKFTTDVATESVAFRSLTKRLIPFLVILRDFGAMKSDRPCSIVDFISDICNSRYQLRPPAGAIEYLLSTSQAVVVFDGLDELLDTRRRAEISEDVRSFSELYPTAPILVTSREVGYEQAPLPSAKFPILRLGEFTAEDSEEYARRWFYVGSGLSKHDAATQAEQFMGDSEAVTDLRANALMLGLMCNLYKGSGYIPRNRPDVYEACSEMLFDRWDRLRQIKVPLNIESLLKPAMQHLAYWIYNDPDLQSGATERRLIEEAKSFFLTRRFDKPEEAELEARRFIEFCRGRAWVFTDTGTTPSGERLYQFTHRTFLEFFAACHLVRTRSTPRKLLQILRPRIEAKEWDVVAQLSFQLLERNVDRAGSALIELILPNPGPPPRSRSINRLDFASRCLAFLVPTPEITRKFGTTAVDVTMDWARTNSGRGKVWASIDRGNPAKAVMEGLAGDPENFAALSEAIGSRLVEQMADESVRDLAAELAIELHGRQNPPGDDPGTAIAMRVMAECKDMLRKSAREVSGIGTDLVLYGELGVGELIGQHGFDPVFQSRLYWMFPESGRVPLTHLAVGTVLWNNPVGFSVFSALAFLEDLAPALEAAEPPWYSPGPVFAASRWALRRRDGLATSGLGAEALNAAQAFSLLCCAAASAEEIARGERPDDDTFLDEPAIEDDSDLLQMMRKMLRARVKGEDAAPALACLDHFELESSQRDLLVEWLVGSIDFVASKEPGS